MNIFTIAAIAIIIQFTSAATDRPRIDIFGPNSDRGRANFKYAHAFHEHHNRDIDSSKVPKLRIAIIGDQGGHHHRPTRQYLNAINAMAAMHTTAPFHSIFTVGDNVYADGIDYDQHNLLDALFKTPFSGKGFDGVPFYPVMGNHDHCGTPDEQRVYSVIGISQYLEATLTRNQSHINELFPHPIWVFPDYFYELQMHFGSNRTVQFIMWDSMIERGASDQYEACKTHKKTDEEIQQRLDEFHTTLQPEQEAWLYRTVRSGDMDYRADISHHSSHSTAKHGGCDATKRLREKVFTDADGSSLTDIKLGGHDHTFEAGKVKSKGFRTAIVGGTRSCDGVTKIQKLANMFAAPLMGRTQRHYRQWHYSQYAQDYRDYYLSVLPGRFGDGWRGCKDGGFATLEFTDPGPGLPLNVILTFYSGNGEELVSEDISERAKEMAERANPKRYRHNADESFGVVMSQRGNGEHVRVVRESDYFFEMENWGTADWLRYMTNTSTVAEGTLEPIEWLGDYDDL